MHNEAGEGFKKRGIVMNLRIHECEDGGFFVSTGARSIYPTIGSQYLSRKKTNLSLADEHELVKGRSQYEKG
jgi:hypothetical protein